MSRKIELIGHGGAGYYHPLNSALAIEKAFELGVDRIEIDIQRTIDGEVVLVHDRMIPLDGVLRQVTGLTFEQVRQEYPAVLTLDAFFALDEQRVPVMLDIKGAGLEDAIAASIRRHDAANWVSACSISPKAVWNLHRRFPRMTLALTWGGQAKYLPARAGTRATYPIFGVTTLAPFISTARLTGATQATINHRMLNKHIVRLMHAAGLYVIAWTVDEPTQIGRALKRGVDAVTSNRPDLVIEIMDSLGYSRLDR